MTNKNIYDVMKCPHCDSRNCYPTATQNVDFAFTSGFYTAMCHCAHCKKDFQLSISFSYDITNYYAQ